MQNMRKINFIELIKDSYQDLIQKEWITKLNKKVKHYLNSYLASKHAPLFLSAFADLYLDNQDDQRTIHQNTSKIFK